MNGVIDMHRKTIVAAASAAASILLLAGCSQTYRTPGPGADLDVLADQDIGAILAKKPAARRPVYLATVRVQASGYTSYTTKGSGYGKFSVITVREVETDTDFRRLGHMPGVAEVAPLSRLLLTDEYESDKPLRQAAAALHADMLLVYTFDTVFQSEDRMKPLTWVSLGFSPNQRVYLTTTASAVVIDVRTGYVYGTCEATARAERRASAWTSQDAIDETRRETERAAFGELIGSVESLWPKIVSNLGEGATADAPGASPEQHKGRVAEKP